MEADLVIIGGGTAGCVIAARIAEARPDLSIIIIESGPDSAGNDEVQRPLQGMFQALMGAQTAKVYTSNASEDVAGRAMPIACGNTLGGGSAVNFMIYNQAPASDWDDWKQPGWSYEEMTPFIRKAIKYQAKGTAGKHGTSGPVVVTNGTHESPAWMEDFFRVVPLTRTMDKLVDMADQEHGDGFGWHAKWINDKGSRSDAYSSYKIAALANSSDSKLKILTNTSVDKVIFDGDRAIGVRLVDGQDVFAKKQVVVAAGGISSPLILERSGLGGREVLENAGVEVKVDLPEVGQVYRDKQLCLSGYHIDESCETLDAFLSLDMPTIQREITKWIETGTGQVGTNGINMGFKWRPTDEEVAKLGYHFESHWKTHLAKSPDKPLVTGALSCQFIGDRSTLPMGKYMAFGWWTNYQASTGNIHISSADPMAPPTFDAGVLWHPADMPVLIWVYKWTREMARRMGVYRGEYAAGHPAFDPTSAAACKRYDGPLENIVNIVYTEADDLAIEAWIRKSVSTAWHSMSTCPMGERADGGVVDARLNVHGVKGLRVADNSIVPGHMGTNMTSVALAIGEKAASMILNDLQ